MTFFKKNIFASLIVLATTTATVVSSGYGMENTENAEISVSKVLSIENTNFPEDFKKSMKNPTSYDEIGIYVALGLDAKNNQKLATSAGQYLTSLKLEMETKGYRQTRGTNEIVFNHEQHGAITIGLINQSDYHMSIDPIFSKFQRFKMHFEVMREYNENEFNAINSILTKEASQKERLSTMLNTETEKKSKLEDDESTTLKKLYGLIGYANDFTLFDDEPRAFLTDDEINNQAEKKDNVQRTRDKLANLKDQISGSKEKINKHKAQLALIGLHEKAISSTLDIEGNVEKKTIEELEKIFDMVHQKQYSTNIFSGELTYNGTFQLMFGVGGDFEKLLGKSSEAHIRFGYVRNFFSLDAQLKKDFDAAVLSVNQNLGEIMKNEIGFNSASANIGKEILIVKS